MMKLFFHFSIAGFSNTYLIGGKSGGDAIIVDPGVMNVPLLNLIEGNNYYIRSVLVTHSHPSHVHGLKTLRRIYDAEIFAYEEKILGFDCISVCGGDSVVASGQTVQVIDVPGHSRDSLAYRIGDYMFTGDALRAGKLGSTESRFANELLLEALKERVLGIEGELLIFPGHGPPTTLQAERMHNPAFRDQ